MPPDSGGIFMGVDKRNHQFAHGCLPGWRGPPPEIAKMSAQFASPIQMLPPGGSICGRLTQDLPMGCLQGGSSLITAPRRLCAGLPGPVIHTLMDFNGISQNRRESSVGPCGRRLLLLVLHLPPTSPRVIIYQLRTVRPLLLRHRGLYVYKVTKTRLISDR